jgi:hypothetical protein
MLEGVLDQQQDDFDKTPKDVVVRTQFPPARRCYGISADIACECHT